MLTYQASLIKLLELVNNAEQKHAGVGDNPWRKKEKEKEKEKEKKKISL